MVKKPNPVHKDKLRLNDMRGIEIMIEHILIYKEIYILIYIVSVIATYILMREWFKVSPISLAKDGHSFIFLIYLWIACPVLNLLFLNVLAGLLRLERTR